MPLYFLMSAHSLFLQNIILHQHIETALNVKERDYDYHTRSIVPAWHLQPSQRVRGCLRLAVFELSHSHSLSLACPPHTRSVGVKEPGRLERPSAEWLLREDCATTFDCTLVCLPFSHSLILSASLSCVTHPINEDRPRFCDPFRCWCTRPV